MPVGPGFLSTRETFVKLQDMHVASHNFISATRLMQGSFQGYANPQDSRASIVRAMHRPGSSICRK